MGDAHSWCGALSSVLVSLDLIDPIMRVSPPSVKRIVALLSSNVGFEWSNYVGNAFTLWGTFSSVMVLLDLRYPTMRVSPTFDEELKDPKTLLIPSFDLLSFSFTWKYHWIRWSTSMGDAHCWWGTLGSSLVPLDLKPKSLGELHQWWGVL